MNGKQILSQGGDRYQLCISCCEARSQIKTRLYLSLLELVSEKYLIETLRVNKGQGAEGQTGKSFMIHMTHSGGGDWS